MKYWDVLLFFTSVSLSAQVFDYDQTGKVTVKVVDEKKQPLETIDIVVGFEHLKTLNAWGARTDTAVCGKTDKDGIFIAESKGLNGVGISAKKEGYYNSYVDYSFKNSENGKYQPWNPTIQLTLRKIVNPVPMYAKNFSLMNVFKIPAVEEPAGYDLMIGDWVKPHGKGEISDMTFVLKRELKNELNFESSLEISMTKQGDGLAPISPEMIIAESDFKLPYEAPQEGYKKNLLLSYSASSDTPNKNGFVSGFKRTCEPEGQNFFIRIRSEVDEKGNVIKAVYGKIVGPIEYRIQESKTATLRFTYYINPDYTRNIEFAPKKNLFVPAGKEYQRDYLEYMNISP